MTRSSRKKEYGASSKLSEDNCTVGTAARTRPFSFGEIMLQRKQKKQPADVKEVIGGKLLGEDATEKVPDAVQSYRKRNKDYLHDDERHAFEDSVDLNSRKKDEGKLFNVNRESHKSERKSKSSPKRRSDVVDRAKRGEIDGHDYEKRKSNKYNDSEKESERKHSRQYVTEDKHAERIRGNTEQEGKRKHRNEDERKAKDRNATKKHDSSKGREPEPKEKRGRKEPSKVLNEVSRLKRGRSRSRERGNDSGRRSISPLPRAHKVKHVSHAVRDHGELSVHSSKDRRKISNPEFDSPEPKEKIENKEPSKVVNEDSRMKRRRSRSRERTRDTGRRSISLSPRARKHASHAVRGQGELPAHSSKDRSGRSISDFDSARMSNNGFSGHHRRHGSSASKLGGYSPRKRRTESAAKTPSPTIRSPEKRSAGWDHPPSKSESSFNGSILSNLQSSAQIVSANEPHVSMMVPVTSSNTTMTGVGLMSTALSPRVENSLDSIQLTQATRPSRRLYVENLPNATSEESVMKCINKFILSSGGHHVQGTHPCISCIINKEKNQALVEFLTPEDASAALSLDSSTFEGSILKVRRPKDFFDASTGNPRKYVAEFGSVSNTVKDSPHKVFVGGISKAISSDMLMEIASIFGPLRAFRYEVNRDLNEPCAFLEYVDQSMTKKACAGLNGMKLGGKVLTVVQAMQNASLIANDENSPCYEIPLHAKTLLEDPTHVLKLKNVIDLQYLSLISETELEEMLEDVRLECARFGTVVSVNVVKTQNPIIAPETNGVGDIVSAVDEADLEYDDTKTRTEVQPDSVHHVLGKLCSADPSSSHNYEGTVDADVHINSDDQMNMVEQSSGVSKPEDGAEAMETSSMADDKLLDNLDKDQVHQPMQGDEGAKVVEDSARQEGSNISIKISNQFDICIDNKEIPDDSFQDNSQAEVPQVEDLISFEQEKPGKEQSMLDGAFFDLDHNVSEELDSTENKGKIEQEFDQGDAFEPGCVLVEFRRTEASCIAAHCLHGRLFDDHVVTVAYVDLESYRNRFPK